ncbi:uncharacterized protein LAJ45_09060 [Morchella importuna]|uniref:uncharacterized protein n=1 Tax=Morchella importuna TaxID=1174673 RepID=UPI001E8DE468|nr:uncharacterized protein LAJ45_09060 [Morchella importuna]KAH8146979.1 hypothetical protein LAJ45_09060 [Morchella importuna]
MFLCFYDASLCTSSASNRRTFSLYGYERAFRNITRSVSLQAEISGSRNILDISVFVCHWYISSQKGSSGDCKKN